MRVRPPRCGPCKVQFTNVALRHFAPTFSRSSCSMHGELRESRVRSHGPFRAVSACSCLRCFLGYDILNKIPNCGLFEKMHVICFSRHLSNIHCRTAPAVVQICLCSRNCNGAVPRNFFRESNRARLQSQTSLPHRCGQQGCKAGQGLMPEVQGGMRERCGKERQVCARNYS
jgi:hypothetical protein